LRACQIGTRSMTACVSASYWLRDENDERYDTPPQEANHDGRRCTSFEFSRTRCAPGAPSPQRGVYPAAGRRGCAVPVPRAPSRPASSIWARRRPIKRANGYGGNTYPAPWCWLCAAGKTREKRATHTLYPVAWGQRYGPSSHVCEPAASFCSASARSGRSSLRARALLP
jgi:hypothetical protein